MIESPTAQNGILTINAGSSSIKFALFEAPSLARLLAGKFERLGLPGARLSVTFLPEMRTEEHPLPAADQASCARRLAELLEADPRLPPVAAIAHRVVHGGRRFSEPHLANAELLEEMRRLSPFAPEHLPAEIVLIEEFGKRYPRAPQVACFDTAFHSGLPLVAKFLPIPRRYFTQGVQRYGFHGLSYTYLLAELERAAGAAAARGRVILAHLGNGASMAAVSDGKCIDTTMAFSPAAGLMMSTRTGDLDPGLVAYLARSEGMTAEQFHRMVNLQSGLLGVSETSPDVRDLLEREKSDSRAAEALALFCYQAKKWIGALAASLGGLDTLVFSGGIGENAASIRARLGEGLDFLGLKIDPGRNAAGAPVISPDGTRVTARVIRTDEEMQMARSVLELINSKPNREKK